MNKKLLSKVFWIAVVVLSAYYLYRGIKFRFFTDGNLDQKAGWYFLHLATAITPLALGPLQFWVQFRKRYIHLHRLLGKIYIIGSILGGLTALYLGLTIDLEGSIAPLTLLSVIWLFMTVAAWITIKKKNIVAHRLFMIRSYALALVFIFLRLIGDIPQDKLFFFISNSELRDTTLEWISWVVPLLIIEMIFSWIPLIRNKTA